MKLNIKQARKVVQNVFLVKSGERLYTRYILPINRLLTEKSVKFKQWHRKKLEGYAEYELALEVLNKCDIEYIHINIAPRGSADGDVLELTKRGRRRMLLLFAKYLPNENKAA